MNSSVLMEAQRRIVKLQPLRSTRCCQLPFVKLLPYKYDRLLLGHLGSWVRPSPCWSSQNDNYKLPSTLPGKRETDTSSGALVEAIEKIKRVQIDQLVSSPSQAVHTACHLLLTTTIPPHLQSTPQHFKHCHGCNLFPSSFSVQGNAPHRDASHQRG